VVGATLAADKDFLALFTANKKESAVNKQITGLEDRWNRSASENYARAKSLAEAGPALAWRAEPAARMKVRAGVWLAGRAGAAFLLLFLVLPVGRVFITAFLDGDGSFTLGHFSAFFGQA
jgi:hypothetical protein